MLILKQSTSVDIRLGPFVDSTNGVTPETSISIGAADQAEVLKANGAATVAMTGTLTAVTGCDGWYDYTVQTGDVDTVGEVVFVLQDSSVCLPVFTRAQVVEEATYDALFGASAAGFDANGRVDVGEILGSAVTAASGIMAVNTTQIEGVDATNQINAECDTALSDYGALQPTVSGRTLDVTTTGEAGVDFANIAGTLDAANIGTDAITAAKLAADAGTEIAAAVGALQVEDEPTTSLINAVAYILSFAAGQATGQATTAPVFRSPNGVEARITATTDGSGNRSAITLNPPT